MSTLRSLRFRLTLVFLGVAGPVLVASAIGVDALVRRSVWASVDAAIVEEAETLANLARSQTPIELAETVERIGREHSPGPAKFVRALDSRGGVRASFGRVPASLAAEPPGSGIHVTTVWEDGAPFRVADYVEGAAGSYEVGVGVHGLVAQLRHTRRVIAALLALLLAVVGSLAWIVTGRATAELTRLAAELETIEAAALEQRLVPRRTAEVDRLASVLNRLLARLEAAMEALRRFTADAAHELRTPIAALRTHVELALGEAPRAGAVRDHLVDVVEQVDRVGVLAENLLMLSAIEAGDRGDATEPVPLDRLLAEVAEVLEPLAQEQGRKLEWRAEPGIQVNGTAGLLKRLVLNLVDNALRHTPSTAAVAVELRRVGSIVSLEIADDGPGIAKDELPRVFERFHRGRSSAAGTGLGLAICREIVLRHRGEIAIESGKGRGTRVRVTLPPA